MIDAGQVIMIVGVLMMFVTPAHRAMTERRWARSAAIGVVLRTSFPAPAPTPPLATLVAEAEAALDRDTLLRGIRGVAMSYDLA